MTDDLAKLETVIVNRFEATAIDAVVAIRNVRGFKAALAAAIAFEINNIPETIACEVASIVAEEEGRGSLIALVSKHLRKASTTPPRYIPVTAIAPAVEAALATFTEEVIDLSSEWCGDTIDFTDW